MHIEVATEDRHVHKHKERYQRTRKEHDGARQNEEERRVVNEDHPKVSPAIAERRELRITDARVELDRNFADFETLAGGPDYHLGCELHTDGPQVQDRSEEHTSELQSQSNLVCRLLLEKKKKKYYAFNATKCATG